MNFQKYSGNIIYAIIVFVALDKLSVPGYRYYLLGDKKNAKRMQITAKRDGEVLRNA